MTKLVLIKSDHMARWVFFNVVISYLLYADTSSTVGKWVWVCIGLVLAEGVVLLFKGFCPLTVIARLPWASGLIYRLVAALWDTS